MDHNICHGLFTCDTSMSLILSAIHFVSWHAKEWTIVMMKFELPIAMNSFHLLEKVGII